MGAPSRSTGGKSTLGLLMFNLGENEGILENARELSAKVDEIVVVDSSSPETRAHLVEQLRPLGGVVVPVLPVGYGDALRAFGVAETSADRVLLLDADERVSPLLREALPGMTEKDAYVIPRLELELRSYTYHMRLLRPSAVRFRGRSFDFPEVEGEVGHLDRSMCLVHHAHFGRYLEDKGRAERYFAVENVERPFVRGYLRDTLSLRVGGRGLSPPGVGRIARPPDAMLSPPMVRLLIQYEFIKDVLLGKGLAAARFNRAYSLGKWRSHEILPDDQRKMLREIAREVRESGGLLDYLNLRDPLYLKTLTASYRWDRKGVDVFRELLLFRHTHGRPMESFHGR